jgi:hypothetical protein
MLAPWRDILSVHCLIARPWILTRVPRYFFLLGSSAAFT